MLRWKQRPQQRWQPQMHQPRQMQQSQQPVPVWRPEEESYQQPGRVPRSCCRRHSARMQRQKRL